MGTKIVTAKLKLGNPAGTYPHRIFFQPNHRSADSCHLLVFVVLARIYVLSFKLHYRVNMPIFSHFRNIELYLSRKLNIIN